jgi:hypothetical protein
MRKSTLILLAVAALIIFAFACGEKAEEKTTGKDVEDVTPGDRCPSCEEAGTCDGDTCEGHGHGGEGKGKGCGGGKGGGRGGAPETEETDDGGRG